MRILARAVVQLIACLLVLAAAAFLADDPPRARGAPSPQATARYDLSNTGSAVRVP